MSYPKLYKRHYRPKFIFFSTPSTTNIHKNPYFGLEVEVEYDNSVFRLAAMISAKQKWCYFKEDLSLQKYGMELVTHPFTYQWFCENKNYLKKSLRELHRFRGRVSRSTGLHIHMNNDVFSAAQLNKFQTFIYSHHDFMLKLSQRSAQSMHATASLVEETLDHLTYKSINRKNPPNISKYVAVNLHKKGTIEVRLFKSTLNILRIQLYIELCYCLCKISQVDSIDVIQLSDLKQFCNNSGNRYSELAKYLKTG